MKKRVFAALMAGVMGTMMFGTTFVSAEAETPELKGEVYAFIAASLNNAMEEIQKNFNETYRSAKMREYPYYRIYVRNYVVYYVVIGNVMEVRRLIYSARDTDRHL